jgi:hypothetical protein
MNLETRLKRLEHQLPPACPLLSRPWRPIEYRYVTRAQAEADPGIVVPAGSPCLACGGHHAAVIDFIEIVTNDPPGSAAEDSEGDADA